MNNANILTGEDAVEYAGARGLTLNKYADPTEGARSDLSVDEADDIAAEDPSLVWIETDYPIVRVNDRQYPIDVVRSLMDDGIAEAVHGTVDSEQEFVDAYIAQHAAKYGEEFTVA